MVNTTAVYDLQGKVVKRVSLPEVFQTPLRPDVIKKVVIAIQSHSFQPQGRDVMAGKRTTAESKGTGYDLSRVPRIKGGGSLSGSGALAPGTVGGRQAHPPVAEKIIAKAINKKERRFATRSAIAATANKDLAASRGHIVSEVQGFPLIVTDDIQSLKTANDVKEAFVKLGVWSDIIRIKEGTRTRGGRGKMRGRRLKHGRGPLIIIAEDKGIRRAASNFLGVEVIRVNNLNAEALAPGTNPGRLTVWTESAVKGLDELFS